VNPTQFNNAEDFSLYPRTLEDDLTLLEQLGVDYCLLPDEQSMYPDAYRYQIHEKELSQCMEGEFRPGHFNGMLTVVLKLLNLIQPQKAYFGEKDYQQYLLIKGMAEALFLPIEIIPCPTIREPSGLACSSRNNRLSPEQRAQADRFAQLFHQDKSLAEIEKELLASGFQIEYLKEWQQRRFIALQVGQVRLIDNYAL
jgi:pantoate--beta-alanine ligase